MKLIAIDTARQFKNVVNIAKHFKTNDAVWTSGTDGGHENIFVWTSSDTCFDKALWHTNEPNNGSGDRSQDCVIFVSRKNKFGLDDDWCDRKHNFICSAELK